MNTISIDLDRDHWWFVVKKLQSLLRKSKWVLENKQPKNPEQLKVSIELMEGIMNEIVGQLRRKGGGEIDKKGESEVKGKEEEMAPKENTESPTS